MSKQATAWLSVLSSVFLFIFAFSYWFYINIYDKNNFQTHMLAGITSQESRNALSGFVIEEAFKNRPVVRSIILDQGQPVLSGLLDGPRVQNILKNFTGKVHDSLFSDNPRAVAIDLTGIKGFVERVFSVIENITEDERPNLTLPDQIILIKQGEIPTISRLGSILIWSGPFILAAFIGLFGYVLWKTADKLFAVMALGVSLVIGSISILLLGRWYEPVLLSGITNSYIKVVGQEVFSEFYSALSLEFYILIIAGVVLFAIGLYLQKKETVAKKSNKT